MSPGDLQTLARRRGFFFQANDAYGGVAGFYTYGPNGAALKRNVEEVWRDRFVTREGNIEIDAPTITPEPVFEASGHLDIFDDMVIECPACGESHRADHLVEDEDETIEDAETLSTDEIGDVIADLDITCPNCGDPLEGEPIDTFNLMFATSIGTGDGQPGYLRPETAQNMFVEFPRLKGYAREQLPFGVAQIGRGYRNEISPRKALLRAREFTMAELELFIDPDRDQPNLESVASEELRLYPSANQETPGTEYHECTVQEAIETGVVNDAWVGYYLGLSKRWFDRIGVDMTRFRFRQHLPGELAHYATDCWDAEAEIEGDWIELEGIANRTDYDLSKHADYADDSFTLFREFEEPRSVEQASVDPDMGALGPEFGSVATDIADALTNLAETDPEAFDSETVTVTVDGKAYEVPIEQTGFSVETKQVHGEQITPHVIEPSFGVGRIVYTVLEHSLREDEMAGDPRTVLQLPPEIAPTDVGVFPLMTQDGLEEEAKSVASSLRESGYAVTYDDSGSIGRRYRRQDEIGTPYGVTIDYETLETETVTIRDRDSAAQRRIDISDLAEHLSALIADDRDFGTLGVEVTDTP